MGRLEASGSLSPDGEIGLEDSYLATTRLCFAFRQARNKGPGHRAAEMGSLVVRGPAEGGYPPGPQMTTEGMQGPGSRGLVGRAGKGRESESARILQEDHGSRADTIPRRGVLSGDGAGPSPQDISAAAPCPPPVHHRNSRALSGNPCLSKAPSPVFGGKGGEDQVRDSQRRGRGIRRSMTVTRGKPGPSCTLTPFDPWVERHGVPPLDIISGGCVCGGGAAPITAVSPW